jgi:large subunit ribosomal protein L3
MSVALIGRKAGMTRIFTDAGETVPVTVIEVLPNRITQVKSVDKDGYRAIQVSFGKKRPQLLSKAAAGHYAKANVEPGKAMVEFRLTEKEKRDYYEKNKQAFSVPGELTLSRIFINAGKDEASALAKAKDIASQAKSGVADFAALARRYSEEELGKKGGVIGAIRIPAAPATMALIIQFSNAMRSGETPLT